MVIQIIKAWDSQVLELNRQLKFWFFSKHVSSYSLSRKLIRLYIEHMQVEVVLLPLVLSPYYEKYGGLVTNVWIYNLWVEFCLERLQLCMIAPTIIPTQEGENILLMEIFAKTGNSPKIN